jgi:hypothetical protein
MGEGTSSVRTPVHEGKDPAESDHEDKEDKGEEDEDDDEEDHAQQEEIWNSQLYGAPFGTQYDEQVRMPRTYLQIFLV